MLVLKTQIIGMSARNLPIQLHPIPACNLPVQVPLLPPYKDFVTGLKLALMVKDSYDSVFPPAACRGVISQDAIHIFEILMISLFLKRTEYI